jgi:hypothetical protein
MVVLLSGSFSEVPLFHLSAIEYAGVRPKGAGNVWNLEVTSPEWFATELLQRTTVETGG